MKKRLLALSLAAGFTALMTACGDETTNTDIIKASIADNVDSLPKCDKSYDGMIASIPSSGQYLICSEGEWQSVLKAIQTSTDSSGKSGSQSGCTAKDLEDKSGITLVCAGQTIATLKNGAKGTEGKDGTPGTVGDKGGAGNPGTSGGSGKDLKLDESDCTVSYFTADLVVYKCGEGSYLTSMKSDKADLKTWNALNLEATVKDASESDIGGMNTIFMKSEAGHAQGSLERWDGDAWEYPTSAMDYSVVGTKELTDNHAIGGKAKLIVETGATLYGPIALEPSVGAWIDLNAATDLYEWGGLCFTYKAKNPMEVIPYTIGKNVVRAKLDAAASETTVDILFSDFKADSANVNVTNHLKNITGIFIKAVGSLKEGTYENEFAIYEIGAYGRCSGDTYDSFKANAEKLKKTGTLRDTRNGTSKNYKTVTIGDRTWFAQNLDYDYKVQVDPEDATQGFVDNLVYEFESSADKAKYGRFYTWAAAIDSATLARNTTSPLVCGNGKTCTLPTKVQGICPDGWHLPSAADIEALIKTLNEDYGAKYPAINIASLLQDSEVDGENWSGLSTKKEGFVFASGSPSTGTFQAWARGEINTTDGNIFYIQPSTALLSTGSKNNYRPVRCVEDPKED